jgi:hypothetical protein
MPEQPLQVAAFMDLFQGNARNFGVHAYKFAAEGKKESGSNSTVTNQLLTIEQYKAHLGGKMGLGVIPITEDNKCHFAAIDVDVYDDLSLYVEAIEANNFPLVPFKSKSGGLHLYLFLKNPADVKPVVDLMQKMTMLLGLDVLVKRKSNKMIEVFPKQKKLQEGGAGNWINLPYYDAERSRQRALRGGRELDLDEALQLMSSKRTTLTEVRSFVGDATPQEGPPCLQTIGMLNDLGEGGGRNNYLFSVGVYLKKSDESFWEQRLHSANLAMRKPLAKDEVEGTIVASLRKKD